MYSVYDITRFQRNIAILWTASLGQKEPLANEKLMFEMNYMQNLFFCCCCFLCVYRLLLLFLFFFFFYSRFFFGRKDVIGFCSAKAYFMLFSENVSALNFPLDLHAFIHLFVRSFVHSFIHSFILSNWTYKITINCKGK